MENNFPSLRSACVRHVIARAKPEAIQPFFSGLLRRKRLAMTKQIQLRITKQKI